MKKDEILEMNALMKSLENDIEEMESFNLKLHEIAEKKEKLEQFYEEKWMDYYESSGEFSEENLEILNQDSLWNALVDCDMEARNFIKTAAAII